MGKKAMKTKAAKKPAMKKAAMKATKKPAMKAAMKKVMKKKPTVAKGNLAKSLVFRGNRVKTSGGLKKTDLKKNKNGKVVSIAMSNAGKKSFRHISGWIAATKKARAELKITGFQALKKGTPFYRKVKEIYE